MLHRFIFPALLLSPWEPLIFFPFPQFCLSRNAMCLRLHSMWPLQTGFFHLAVRMYRSSVSLSSFASSCLYSTESFFIVWMDHSVSLHSLDEGRPGCFFGDGFDCYLLGRSQGHRRAPPGHPHRTPPQQRTTQLRMSVVQRWRSVVENTS